MTNQGQTKYRILEFIKEFILIALMPLNAIFYGLDFISALDLQFEKWGRVEFPISVGVYFLISLWEIIKLREQIKKAQDNSPNIEIIKYGVEKKYFRQLENDALFIEFINNPKNLTGKNTAERVHATVKWIDSKNQTYNVNTGRWFYPDPQNFKPLELQSVEIEPNNETKKLHIAIKRPDCEWHEIWSRSDDNKDIYAQLHEKKYSVIVSLKGRNVDKQFLFWVDVIKSGFSIEQQ